MLLENLRYGTFVIRFAQYHKSTIA